MRDVINLNKARKAKLKQQKAVQAAENRIIFGIPKGERKLEQVKTQRAKDAVDGHRRDLAAGTKPIDDTQ